MHRTRVFFLALSLLVATPLSARADEGWYPIKADDGTAIDNHRVPVELESEIEKLPGVVIAGNPHGEVTVNEFYDLNCPFCRQASGDIAAMVRGNPELRLVLVPFPVLGIPSIQGTLVELGVARVASPQKFYEFHEKIMSSRGVTDATRAAAVAKEMGLDVDEIMKIANEKGQGAVMVKHVKLGDALAIQATPGFVIKGVAILGYPGPKSLARIIEAVQRCDNVVCGQSPR